MTYDPLLTYLPTGRPLRLPVTDVFKSKSGALVVGGKLEAGAAKAGTRVVVVPGMQVRKDLWC
jgi:translation elongation factor EF-1alpha